MKTNTKQLKLLLKFLNITLILVGASMIFAGYFAMKSIIDLQKYNIIPNNVPLNGAQILKVSLFYFTFFKTIAIRVFYLILLWTIRSIVKDILSGMPFHEGQADKIRKLAIYLLWFAGILAVVLLIFIVGAITKGNPRSIKTVITALINIFQNYVLTALITFGIAEVFTVGTRLQKEQTLTI